MDIRGSGIMGKWGIWGILVLMAFFAYSSAFAAKKPKHARVLPSKVKTITLEPRHKGKVHVTVSAVHSTQKRDRDVPRISNSADHFAPELLEKAGENPESSKFFKSALRFARSSYALPESYNCDPESAAQKRAEAEIEALNDCEASGAHNCRIAESLIRVNGILSCGDFPGAKCPAKAHFRGCKAEALALGEVGEHRDTSAVAGF
jgi:hypothetical protein